MRFGGRRLIRNVGSTVARKFRPTKRRNHSRSKVRACTKKAKKAIDEKQKTPNTRHRTRNEATVSLASFAFDIGRWGPAVPWPCEGGLNVGRFPNVLERRPHTR